MPKPNNYKVCSECGKSEGANWARHWKNQHPAAEVKQLTPGDVPPHPFDESWLYLIKPLALRDKYMIPAKFDEVPVVEGNQPSPLSPLVLEFNQSQPHPPTLYMEIDDESDDIDFEVEQKEAGAIPEDEL